MKVLPLCEHALRWFMIFDALVYLLQFMYTLMGTNRRFPENPFERDKLDIRGYLFEWPCSACSVELDSWLVYHVRGFSQWWAGLWSSTLGCIQR